MRPRWVAALALVASRAWAQTAQRCEIADPDAVARVRATVERLADDALEGREPGTRGDRQTVEYLTRALGALGAEAAGEHGYEQSFTVPYGVQPGGATALTLTRGDERINLSITDDFRVVTVPGEAAPGRAEGPLVFAGHGLVSEPAGWDDFAHLGSLRGKIAVVLAGRPEPVDPARRRGLDQHHVQGSLWGKVHYARARGAIGVIVVETASGALGATPYLEASGQGIPVVRVSSRVGAQLLGASPVPLGAPPTGPRALGWSAALVVETEARSVTTSNVIARFRGASPERERLGALVIGAHRDHIGHGVRTSRTPGSTDIHNGADDNASGTAVVLEIAGRIARARLPRDVVTVWFGAEELGLLGSQHLVAHPVPATANTAAMFNFDMVGRLRGCRLFVEASQSGRGFEAALRAANGPYQFDARPWEPSRGSWGSSDHESFLQAHIPALFFFTGLHDDYHSPSDDPATLNYEGLASVAGFAEAVLRGAAAAPEGDLRPRR